MAIAYNTSVVRDGLVLHLDAANPKSYPGTGSVWTDLSGNGVNATLVGSPTYNTSNGGSFEFNGTDSQYATTSVSQNYLDCTIVAFAPSFPPLRGIIATGVFTDKSIRLQNDSLRNPGDPNDWAYTSTTNFYVNGQNTNIVPDTGWFTVGGARTNFGAGWGTNFPLHIASGYTGRFWLGRIAAILMYNKVLTIQEQNQNYEALRGRYGI